MVHPDCGHLSGRVIPPIETENPAASVLGQKGSTWKVGTAICCCCSASTLNDMKHQSVNVRNNVSTVLQTKLNMPKAPLSVIRTLGQWALCGQILFRSPINTFKVSMRTPGSKRAGSLQFNLKLT